MIPRARSDQLFPKNGGVASLRTEEEKTREELFGPDSGEGEDDSSVAVRSRSSLSRGSSTKKRQPANKERSRRRNRVLYPEDNQFNKLMNMMIERNTIQKAEEESEESKELKDAMKVTQLMSAFKEAKEAMGGPIKAAYQCPAFVRFLDKAERREFKRYKAEQEADDSEDGEDEGLK
jgi:flagellar hook-basal body complex protein FliE